MRNFSREEAIDIIHPIIIGPVNKISEKSICANKEGESEGVVIATNNAYATVSAIVVHTEIFLFRNAGVDIELCI